MLIYAILRLCCVAVVSWSIMIEYTQAMNHALISYLTEADQKVSAVSEVVEDSAQRHEGTRLMDLNQELLEIVAELSAVNIAIEGHFSRAMDQHTEASAALRGLFGLLDHEKKIQQAATQGKEVAQNARGRTLPANEALQRIGSTIDTYRMVPGIFILAERSAPDKATNCRANIQDATDAAVAIGELL